MDLLAFKASVKMSVDSAPAGLFLLEDGELICISQYRTGVTNHREAFIVDGGETYCGGDDKLGWPVQLSVC